jgi:hypothetical protein
MDCRNTGLKSHELGFRQHGDSSVGEALDLEKKLRTSVVILIDARSLLLNFLDTT